MSYSVSVMESVYSSIGILNELAQHIDGLKSITSKSEKCVIRESNSGLIDGNDEFYH